MRRLTPTEQLVSDIVIAPMKFKVIYAQATAALGPQAPKTTIACAIANLVNQGVLTKTPRPNVSASGGKATGRVMVYGPAPERRAQA